MPEEYPPTCQIRGWVVFGPGPHKGDLYTPEMIQRIGPNFERLRGHTIPQASAEFKAIGGNADRESKIGHDAEQEIARKLKESKGFLSTGRIIAVRDVVGYPGYIEIDEDNIPATTIGGEINAGRLPGGSIEILPQLADPDDPSKTIPGPILTGIAHLGHEQPAVRNWPPELRARARPVAVFEDGTPVPANKSIPSEWLAAMAETEKRMSQESEDKDYSKFAAFRGYSEAFMPGEKMATFTGDGGPIHGKDPAGQKRAMEANDPWPRTHSADSGGTAMNPEMKAKLMAQGFNEEQCAKVMSCMADMPSAASVPPAAAPAAAPAAGPAAGAAIAPENAPMEGMASDWKKMSDYHKKMSEDAAMSPEMKAEHKKMSDLAGKYIDEQVMGNKDVLNQMSANFSELTKRMGALEKVNEDMMKSKGSSEMAAFTADLDYRLNGKWVDRDGKRALDTDHRRLPYKLDKTERDALKEQLMFSFGPGSKQFSDNATNANSMMFTLLDKLALRQEDRRVTSEAVAPPARVDAAGKPIVPNKNIIPPSRPEHVELLRYLGRERTQLAEALKEATPQGLVGRREILASGKYDNDN